MRYGALIAAALVLALAISWTPVATSIDNSAYDWMCRLYPVDRARPYAAVVAINEDTLQKRGGMRALRTVLAEILEQLEQSKPAVVAIDFTLADPGDPSEDARLARALARVPHLILATDLSQDGAQWQDPVPLFAREAEALGHVHAEPDPVCRKVLLEKASGRDRRWALALEAFRQGRPIVESPGVLETRNLEIPREVRIRFSRRMPPVDPGQTAGRAVFIGATALTAARDRLTTPLGDIRPGVEIHAQLYETLAEGRFRREIPASLELGLCVGLAGMAGGIFWKLRGWPAYTAAALTILAAHGLPHLAFQHDRILSSFGLLATAWLTTIAAAAYQAFQTRRHLISAEADRTRYQQAIHWVTHEMRTPLTAIQGSSELMTRYNLPAEKQKQMADMINSESKRLARMIQAFLNVERLSAGQMELRGEPLKASELLDACVRRVQPLAERRQQRIEGRVEADAFLKGDRELMEFALYNLLTNAVKYSPEETEVRAWVGVSDGTLSFSVQDRGIGIAEKDLPKLGTRFFRTAEAERSGIEGTGIGLSIVREIVVRHGGSLEVSSRVGEGSCFTMKIPATTLPQPGAPEVMPSR